MFGFRGKVRAKNEEFLLSFVIGQLRVGYKSLNSKMKSRKIYKLQKLNSY